MIKFKLKEKTVHVPVVLQLSSALFDRFIFIAFIEFPLDLNLKNKLNTDNYYYV